MEEDNKPIIGISCGDLNGIGLEVIMKTFADTQMLDLCTPILFASSKVVSYHRKALNYTDFNYQVINSIDQIHHRKFCLLNSWQEAVDLDFGKNNNEVGAFALKSIDAGLQAWKEGKINALVTAPINKNNIEIADKPFTGHTGYIGDAVNGEPLMILTANDLRVALVTGHIAVSEIASQLTEELIVKRINQLHTSLVEDFGVRKPKIAVLGLNPHAGDNELMGDEETRIIKPAIEKCFEKGMIVYGPYAADGFFGAETYKQFDATLAMYHDQGLIAFKTLAFEHGVNFTAGLPIVRTSPDHGTGLDIAGKGVASEVSFREAVYLAIQIAEKRLEYKELNSNVLEKQKVERGRER
jgi:4-hydroxythreonine-4-phosphate dehydrogenase